MKEEDIRPQHIFDEYLLLCEQDARHYFDNVAREDGVCPACTMVGSYVFSKFGFDYEVCQKCQTLFVNPRPVSDAFTKYYTESLSSKYWASTFYKETADARREKLWKPKAKMVSDVQNRYDAAGHAVIDIGGGYGLFAEEMEKYSSQPITVIEPGPALASICRDKSLHVVEKFLEQVEVVELPDGPKTFVSFELFEHLHNPAKFLECLYGIMSPGDIFLFTTLSGVGLDVQVLWENSKSVSPPHHLNFFNPHSVSMLIERIGLRVLDITTPGKLDIDILVNNEGQIKDRFWQMFVSTASEDVKAHWQRMIAETGWSSHMLAVCCKP